MLAFGLSGIATFQIYRKFIINYIISMLAFDLLTKDGSWAVVTLWPTTELRYSMKATIHTNLNMIYSDGNAARVEAFAVICRTNFGNVIARN